MTKFKDLSNFEDLTNLEELYLQAKKAYYTGDPIMTDDEFDRLEEYLRKMKSPVINIVGFEDDDRNAKFLHLSKMLSLAKFQASVDGTPPLQAMMNWVANIGRQYLYEATPKFDGNAVNVIYKKGRLHAILSRGNGIAGRDYTKKLFNLVPAEIPLKNEIIEVRGEVVIQTQIFNRKYSKFKNERNFVAGILNREEDTSQIIQDFDFMAVEARIHSGNQIFWAELGDLYDWGFNHKQSLFSIQVDLKNETRALEECYFTMLKYRLHDSPFRLDGFVLKAPTYLRSKLGENSHDPNWAVAIKFPPQEALTEIQSIQWNFGKTGEYTPIAIMKPVNLDGTTVSRATLFNYGYVKNMGAFPGAQVSIAKSGDIIPQIIKVIKPNHKQPHDWFPKHCYKCNHELKIDKIHLICPNESCQGKAYSKFVQGFNYLAIDGSAGVTIRKLWNAGFASVLDILDKSKFNKDNLIKSGAFKQGKTLDKLLEQVYRIQEIPLSKLLLILAFDGMGSKTAQEVAKQISGLPYDFTGLEKRVVEGFTPGCEKREKVDKAIQHLKNNGIKVIFPNASQESGIPFEMTGSPKAFGFKTKAEFIEYAKEKGYRHTNLKDAKILFTDDLRSTSNKMKEAIRRSVQIKLYSEI